MKIGQLVNYYDENGNRSDATVLEITGMGESKAKTLDLQLKAATEENAAIVAENVKHDQDAAENEASWLPKGERRQRKSPDHVEPPETEIVLASFPEVTDTAPPKDTTGEPVTAPRRRSGTTTAE